MRDNVKAFVKILSETLPCPEPVVEIGSLQVFGQVGYANLRPFFPGKHYIGCDMRPGPGVDRIERFEALTFADSSVGSLLALDTLEHVARLPAALDQAFRVLRPNGLFVISSHMFFPIHAEPNDYWRFTPEAFALLLERFPTRWVFYQGDPAAPHTVLAVASKAQLSEELKQAVARRLPEIPEAYPDLHLNALRYHEGLLSSYWRLWASASRTDRLKALLRLLSSGGSAALAGPHYRQLRPPDEQGFLDYPRDGEIVFGLALVQGWVLGLPLRTVHIWVDGAPVAEAERGRPRRDLAPAFPQHPEAATAGFAYLLDFSGVSPGLHRVSAVGVLEDLASVRIGERLVYVAPERSRPVTLYEYQTPAVAAPPPAPVAATAVPPATSELQAELTLLRSTLEKTKHELQKTDHELEQSRAEVKRLQGQVAAEWERRCRKISLCIPTKNAGPGFADNLRSFLAQQDIPPLEIVVVDSGSTDGTVETARSLGARVYSIPPREFNHGETRNFLARQAEGDILVFTVQDARATHPRSLAELIAPLLASPDVVATTGKQLPRPDADLFARWEVDQHNRTFDRGKHRKTLSSLQEFLQRDAASRRDAIAFDNVFSAIRRPTWEQFPFNPSEFGEDLDWAFRVLLQGAQIAYTPDGTVLHSHNRTPYERLQRSFITQLSLNRILQLPPARFPAEEKVVAAARQFLSMHMALSAQAQQAPLPIPQLRLPRNPTYLLARLWQQRGLPGRRIVDRLLWDDRPLHRLKQQFNLVGGLMALHLGPLAPVDAAGLCRHVAAIVLGAFLGDYYYSCVHHSRLTPALECLYLELEGRSRPNRKAPEPPILPPSLGAELQAEAGRRQSR